MDTSFRDRQGDAASGPDQVGDLVDRARSWGAEQAEPLKRKALDFAEEQKQAGAERLDDAARAVDRAAEELETRLPYAAKYVRDAAAGIDRVSAALKEHGVEEVPEMLSRATRAQPLAVFGGAVLAGFLLSRFLKSSAGRAGPAPAGGAHAGRF